MLGRRRASRSSTRARSNARSVRDDAKAREVPVTAGHSGEDPTPGSRCDELLTAIATEEARLARLDTERVEVEDRLVTLRSELASLGSEPELRGRLPQEEAPRPQTPAQKVSLFRSLFRGREDVYPTRFVSKKTGKPGYAPACANKFVRGVCGLPTVKCGECPNQAFATTLAQVPDGESCVVLATGRYAGEGFDDARLDTLFLAMPIS